MTEICWQTWLVFQPSLRNQLGPSPRRTKFIAHGHAFSCPLIKRQTSKLQFSTVVSTEPKPFVRKHVFRDNSSSSTGQLESAEQDSEDVDERERLRRMRISRANKGNTPWNKGRKHSAETLQRIRERTRLAMQNPKVKMKLVNLGHAQSEETREKIGIGVRMGWERRRERLMVQETCLVEWQSLIAEASRRGYIGEEELLWDSYKILDEQLKNEWLESVEQRKSMPRPKGSKRAPKSAEQKRKIAEAIVAKWADPAYRERVCCGLAKYHGSPIGGVKKPRKKRSGLAQSTRQSTIKRKGTDVDDTVLGDTLGLGQRLGLRGINKPKYKDPLISSKLEMIKSIRSQRVAAESRKSEAVERARLLIAEAEKAAKALEIAATKSPIAQASLMETRELIAEAIQSIESIESIERERFMSNERGEHSFVGAIANEVVNESGEDNGSRLTMQREANGCQSLSSIKVDKLTSRNLTALWRVNGIEQRMPRRSSNHSPPAFNFGEVELQSYSSKQHSPLELNGIIKCNHLPNPIDDEAKVHELDKDNGKLLKPLSISKKWVRGRLVEVSEEAR